MPIVTKDTPRRCHIELLNPAEVALRNAMLAIEELPANEALTDAVVSLQRAAHRLADYFDAMAYGSCKNSPE